MTEEKRLSLLIENGIAHIRLVRPQLANSIDLAFAMDLKAAAEACKRAGVGVVLISAEGRHFCAGGDVKSFADRTDLESYLEELIGHFHSAISVLVEMDAPLVVAVEGSVAGAGLGLVSAADLVVASASSTFVMAYTRLGLTPDGSTSWFLPRLIGLRRTLDLVLTNRVLDAAEALDWGLISRLVDDGAALSQSKAIAESLANGPSGAYGASARLVRDILAILARDLSYGNRNGAVIRRNFKSKLLSIPERSQ